MWEIADCPHPWQYPLWGGEKMDDILPKRKPNRLSQYDYSQDGIYFITICTQHRKWLFWNVDMTLSSCGRMVQQAIANIPKYYPTVRVDHYVIMPDHVHLLLCIPEDQDGRSMIAPTVSRIIQQFKGYVTKKAGHPVWQKSFYDHIIRNQAEYCAVWEYIETNPIQYKINP